MHAGQWQRLMCMTSCLVCAALQGGCGVWGIPGFPGQVGLSWFCVNSITCNIAWLIPCCLTLEGWGCCWVCLLPMVDREVSYLLCAACSHHPPPLRLSCFHYQLGFRCISLVSRMHFGWWSKCRTQVIVHVGDAAGWLLYVPILVVQSAHFKCSDCFVRVL